jgi:acetyl-CoA C-acetyltransferase
MVAGGMESMTNAPHLMLRAAAVFSIAMTAFTTMMLDGLEDAYDTAPPWAPLASSARTYQFTREAQDAGHHQRVNCGGRHRVRRLPL